MLRVSFETVVGPVVSFEDETADGLASGLHGDVEFDGQDEAGGEYGEVFYDCIFGRPCATDVLVEELLGRLLDLEIESLGVRASEGGVEGAGGRGSAEGCPTAGVRLVSGGTTCEERASVRNEVNFERDERGDESSLELCDSFEGGVGAQVGVEFLDDDAEDDAGGAGLEEGGALACRG